MALTSDLLSLGWRPDFAAPFADLARPGDFPGRILKEQGNVFWVACDGGVVIQAFVAGSLRHRANDRADMPTVGDWVVLERGRGKDRGLIRTVLPRRSRFIRKVAGDRSDEQVVAANIDTVFLVHALDRQFNPRRIERYLTAAAESGAAPVLVLTKSDLVDSVDRWVDDARAIAENVPVHAVSVETGWTLEALDPYLRPAETVALIGPSGAGKSTLTNRLAGVNQRTATVSAEADRGRHTTSHREIFALPSGALLMDTPGIRELRLWDSDGGADAAFPDIIALGAECRFRNCRHESEPGCAVRNAVASGHLDEQRLSSYRKLKLEEEAARILQRRSGRSGPKAGR